MEVLTVEQAAEKLKLRPSTILRHIRKGRLQAKRFGHLGYRIAERSLELFLMPDEQPVSKKT
jgi:excisionase family DNA binding protein